MSTVTTMMSSASRPQTVARSISGHKTSSMLDRYNVSDTKDQRLALELSKRWAEAQEKTANVAEIRR